METILEAILHNVTGNGHRQEQGGVIVKEVADDR